MSFGGGLFRLIRNALKEIMAPELSSNWKRLQARLKAEPASTAPKRKLGGDDKAAAVGVSDAAHPAPHKRRKQDSAPLAAEASRSPQAAGRPAMGTTQSSILSNGSASTVAPSLAFWAADNDISPESLAEAYGLGVRANALLAQNVRENEGLAPAWDQLGKYVALDCEMVGVGPGGYESVLARASLVDFHGRQVYDSFVKPREPVTDWRTPITGIGPRQMATARPFEDVQCHVALLLEGRILVGHHLKNDLDVLMLTHPAAKKRDTVHFPGFRQYAHGRKPALRTLAREVLGVEIHEGVHSSVEDARVTMLLFRKKKPEFDVDHANRFESRRGSHQALVRRVETGEKKKTRKAKRGRKG